MMCRVCLTTSQEDKVQNTVVNWCGECDLMQAVARLVVCQCWSNLTADLKCKKIETKVNQSTLTVLLKEWQCVNDRM